MKRFIFLPIIALLVCLTNLHAQDMDCGKYSDIQGNSFNEITENAYNTYIRNLDQNNVFPDSKNLARCWLNMVAGYAEFQQYTIPAEFIDQYPDLILLIINSETLSDTKEKQSWFDLYPLMNNEQITKLHEILSREGVKLAEIEQKYEQKQVLKEQQRYAEQAEQERKESIRSERSEIFLGICIDDPDNPTLDIWKNENEKLISLNPNETGNSAVLVTSQESVVLITPQEKDDILYYYSSIDSTKFNSIYDKFMEYYLDRLLDIANSDLDNVLMEYDNIDYLYSYWQFFMDDMENKPDKLLEREKLATIALENYVSEQGDKDKIRQTRLWALYSASNSQNKYFESCKNLLQLKKEGFYGISSPQGFLFPLFHIIDYEQDAACKQCIEKLNSALIDEYYNLVSNNTFLENINRYLTETHLMIADYYIEYSSTSNDLKSIVKTIRDDLSTAILNDNVWYGTDSNNPEWYSSLNQAYLANGSLFENSYTIEELKTQLYNPEFSFKTNDERIAATMEYLTYYALHQIINSKDNIIDIENRTKLTSILNEAIRIGNLSGYKAFNYLEKNIAAVMLNKINQPILVVDKNPPSIMVLSPSDQAKVLSKTVELKGMITDASTIKFLIINDDTVSITSGIFNAPVSLVEGVNTITLSSADEFGNLASVSHTLICEPSIDDFENRKNIALLFAINDYDDDSGWPDLKNPISDAERFAKELVQYGFDTVIVRNPSKAELQQNMRRYVEIFAREKLNNYDQFLLFYSGHGEYDEIEKIGYLACRDSKQSDYFKNSYINYETISAQLDRMNCNHVLFISDACYSGSFFKNIATRGNEDEYNISTEELKRRLEHKSRLFLGSAELEQSPDDSETIKKMFELFRTNNTGIITYNQIITYMENAKQPKSFGGFGDNEPGASFIFYKKKP